MRIRHVVNTVGPSARADLLDDQRRTLDSMRRAMAALPDGVTVEVVAVRFADDPLPVDWLVDGPLLERSVLDLVDSPQRRRLPLLADLLGGFGPSVGAPWDIGVFTNIDIALQPTFYGYVADLHRRGVDAFTVNRRTVEPSTSEPSYAELAAAVGEPHAGHDCFVFTPQVLARVDVDQVCVGVPLVGWAMLIGLALEAEQFRMVTDAHLTFHVGNDMPWSSSSYERLLAHNVAAYRRARAGLVARHGEDRVAQVVARLERDEREFVTESRFAAVRRSVGRRLGRGVR